MARKLCALFFILHYNHLPMLLVNFKMSQADLKNAHNTVALQIPQLYIKFKIKGRLHQFWPAKQI